MYRTGIRRLHHQGLSHGFGTFVYFEHNPVVKQYFTNGFHAVDVHNAVRWTYMNCTRRDHVSGVILEATLFSADDQPQGLGRRLIHSTVPKRKGHLINDNGIFSRYGTFLSHPLLLTDGFCVYWHIIWQLYLKETLLTGAPGAVILQHWGMI